MNDKVKVGLDEWLVVDAARSDLITDGLNGCVAVGLAKGDKLSLAHVYSDCGPATWDDYKIKLDAALEASGMGSLDGTKAVLVYAQGDVRQGGGADWLPSKLEAWLQEKGATVDRVVDSGCHVSAADGQLACLTKSHGQDQDAYRYGYLTSSDQEAGLLHRGRLSGNAKPADLPHPSQAEKDYAGPRLNDAQHPANGLYTSILAKLPEDAGDFGSPADIAAALTVRALRQGLTRADTVEFGQAPNDDRLFVAQDPQGVDPKGAFVDIGQVADYAMKFSSHQAAALSEQQAQALQQVAQQVVQQPSGVEAGSVFKQ